MKRTIHIDDVYVARVGSVQEYRDKLAGITAQPKPPVDERRAGS